MSYQLDSVFSSQQIHLQSEDANFYINGIGHSIYYFKTSINPPNHISMLISLVDSQIPISYYTITNSNNILDYTVNSINYTYNIDIGNPDAISLKSELNSNLNDISVSYNNSKNQYTFTSNYDFSINSNSTCLGFLGLSNTTHNSVNKSLSSDNVVNLSGTKSIYILTNLLNHNIDSRTGQRSKVLAKIPVQTSSNGILKYNNKNNFKSLIDNRHINHIEISLENDNREIIDFNGIHYSLTLQIDFIERKKYYYRNDFDFITKNKISNNIIKEKNGVQTKKENEKVRA